METETLRDQSAFITHRELVRTQDALRSEMSGKIDSVDDKVDNLRDMVLPLLETSKQTAENTRKMAESMDRFTEGQRATNGKLYEKLNGHDVSIEGLKLTAGANVEKKKSNALLIGTIITAVAGVITGLFTLAPYIFN